MKRIICSFFVCVFSVCVAHGAKVTDSCIMEWEDVRKELTDLSELNNEKAYDFCIAFDTGRPRVGETINEAGDFASLYDDSNVKETCVIEVKERIQKIVNSEKITAYNLLGMASKKGNATDNQALSERRFEAIKNVFLSGDVRDDNLVFYQGLSAGARYAASSSQQNDAQQARTVCIKLYDKNTGFVCPIKDANRELETVIVGTDGVEFDSSIESLSGATFYKCQVAGKYYAVVKSCPEPLVGVPVAVGRNDYYYKCVPPEVDNISKLYAQLTEGLFLNTDRSVWVNKEGKFNTARLASDTVAATLLGTIGGVVTGVVVRKAQTKKGFEGLHCTVGGQPMADWGDDFVVGMK